MRQVEVVLDNVDDLSAYRVVKVARKKAFETGAKYVHGPRSAETDADGRLTMTFDVEM